MSLLVEAEGIRKTYSVRKGHLEVLRGVSLRVDEGEAVSIVGVSGAGKSTLLHVLGGLDRPDDGHVLISGVDLFGVSSARRTRIRASSIGFVFQSYHLLPEMDVLENVMLPSMARTPRLSSAEMRRKAFDLLDAVGLATRADHTPLELSGGEQQRVALARALMNNPGLVLADEPTGNLDGATGQQLLSHLFEMTRERGHTLVIVTHDEKIAAACDRTLSLSEGQLVPA